MKDYKRLFYDVEIIPCLGWFWRTGKQQVTYKQILEENKIICLAYKEQYSKKTHVLYWDDKQNDKALVEEFQDIAQNYDVVIGQNSINFDNRHVAARLAKHSSKPLNIMCAEDTYRQAKRSLNLPAYNLDYMARYFGLGNKAETGGIDLWLDVWLKNDRSKLLKMGKYCKQDTILAEAVYNRLYPYVDHKLNRAVILEDSRACPHCGKDKLVINRYRYTRAGKKTTYLCKSCHRYSTGGSNELDKPSTYPR